MAKAPGTDFVNGLDPNPLHWPSEIGKQLGLVPDDVPGTPGYDPTIGTREDKSLTSYDRAGGGQTNTGFDPLTGQYYEWTGSDERPVLPGSVASQVGASRIHGMEQQGRADAYGARESDIFGQQSDLAGYLNDVIAGKTPSVAERQLGAGLDSIKRSAVGMASGAGGANSPLMQLAALNAGSLAGAQTNQQQSIVRADEQARARAELANLLNAQEGSSRGLYTEGSDRAYNYFDQAMRGESAREGLSLSADAAKAKGSAAVLTGIGNFIGSATTKDGS